MKGPPYATVSRSLPAGTARTLDAQRTTTHGALRRLKRRRAPSLTPPLAAAPLLSPLYRRCCHRAAAETAAGVDCFWAARGRQRRQQHDRHRCRADDAERHTFERGSWNVAGGVGAAGRFCAPCVAQRGVPGGRPQRPAAAACQPRLCNDDGDDERIVRQPPRPPRRCALAGARRARHQGRQLGPRRDHVPARGGAARRVRRRQ